MEFETLKQKYVEEIVMILQNKYKNARNKLPLLSSRYEDSSVHRAFLDQHIDNEKFIVCLKDQQVVGFIYGVYLDDYKGTAKGALVLPRMHVVKEDCDKLLIYNKMYQFMSQKWAEDGCYTHSICLYVNEKELIEPFVYNGFGMYVIDAVRSLDKIQVPNINDDIKLREATEYDLVNMRDLYSGINKHLQSPPIFLKRDKGTHFLKDYTKWLKVKNNKLWVAEDNKEFIGYLKTNTSEINQDELRDEKTLGINGAFVKPEYRGKYIMSRLINKALEWARLNNLKRCATDFESANYEGRNFWLKNFTPYTFSFIRRIDERNYLK